MSEVHASRVDTDVLLRALAHEERRDIVRRLASESTVPKPDTVAAHHVHVPMMEEAGIVHEKDGLLNQGRNYRDARRLLGSVEQ